MPEPTNVVALIQRPDGSGPEALIAQLTDGVRYAREQGETVGVIACLVRKLPCGGWSYDVCYTPLPAEQVLWAGNRISRKAYEHAYDDGPPLI
jgi:hypothetical protein